MRSCSPSVSPTWHHALTIPEEEKARMVLTFEWVSACPLLFLLSTLRSAWLQAPYIYNNCVCVCFLLLLLLQQLNAFLCCFWQARIPRHQRPWALLNGCKLILDALECTCLTSQMGSVLWASLFIYSINVFHTLMIHTVKQGGRLWQPSIFSPGNIYLSSSLHNLQTPQGVLMTCLLMCALETECYCIP